jgi:phosphonate transport system permease protein
MRQGLVLIVLLVVGLAAYLALGLELGGLLPNSGGFGLLGDFLGAALRPAFDYESGDFPADWLPFYQQLLIGLWRTIVFAAAAIGLSIVIGLPLAILASSLVPLWVRIPCRALIAGMRSVHELLWAVVLLAAVGLNSAGAVLALTIPYAGTLAKIFSEMLDEAPREAFRAVRLSGSTRLQAFMGALLPRAAPDMAAYTFYRFECALRSAAVLGFFGYPTIGYYLKLAFENLHFREVWTWLYLMIVMVLLLEAWSSALRKRFVA